MSDDEELLDGAEHGRRSRAWPTRSCRRLIERLANSELGELEVRENGWRVRLRRPMADGEAGVAAGQPAAQRQPHPCHGAGGIGSQPPRRATPCGRRRLAGSRLLRTAQRRGGRVASCAAATSSATSTSLACARRSSAPVDGALKAFEVESGQAVEFGQPIARVEAEAGERDVQQDPDRQPRRDRAAHPARVPQDGHRVGRRVQRGRSRLARRAARGRGGVHRARAESRRSYLSAPALLSAALVAGLRRDPPGLRLPVRGRHVRRDDARPWPDVHRPAARGARALRVEGRARARCWASTACPRSRARACCATTPTRLPRPSGSATRC